MKYNTESCAVELSLRDLCKGTLRRGDLDSYAPWETELPRDEKELFYRLQAEAGAYYNPDVELCNTVLLSGIYFTVDTRVDGIIRRSGETVVDKIKCVKGKSFYATPDEYTLGMLKCSAYFLCVRDGLDLVDGRVSYYNTDTKKLKYFRYKFLLSELRTYYMELLSRIEYKAKLLCQRTSTELLTAQNAVFPYTELREGQERMIRECYSAMRRGRRIFVEAPTGTGKTISALFPAVRALGKGYCDKIFYLTPKTATRREAFAAAARLHVGGVLQRTVVLSAKEQMCVCSARAMGVSDCCNSKICEFARGYYDRVDGALREILDSYRGYSRSLIMEVAQKHRVCPYELSLDLSELCDIIICDYNYAFDPNVYLRRYFGAEGRGQTQGEKYIFLIDEAHNFTDRAREMYSCELRLSEFEKFTAELSDDTLYGDELCSLFQPVITAFRGIKKLCRDNLVKDDKGNDLGFYMGNAPIESISRALELFRKKSGEWLKKNDENPYADRLTALLSAVRKYITIEEFFDTNFRAYAEICGGDIAVKLYCHDPSEITNNLLMRAVSAVMFSATLTPPEYFCDVLGGGKGAQSLKIESPFPTENLSVTVAGYVNTRFEVREDNAKRFASVIAATVSAKAGNYIAYFPSYECLEQTYKAFAQKYPRVETVVQKKHMNAVEREHFLSAFKADSGKMRVGFCVLGGIFSEGVDLPGSRLIGCIIFGVGLPGLSNERNIIKEHFDMKSDEGMGYDYAYTFPGMNNVLQAAGRVIRTEQDRGVVVLADDRYATQKYKMLFPPHWKNINYAENASLLAEFIRDFWKKQP